MGDLSRFDELLGLEIHSTKLERDVNGFVRVMFDEEELAEVNKYLSDELNRTYEDFTPRWSEAVDNLETYRAIKLTIQNSGEQAIYPAPLARIPANQIIAATYNDVLKPRPIFSFDAYLGAEYDVPTPVGGGTPMMPVQTEKVNAEDIAKALRSGYEFIVRERIQFPKKLFKAVKGAVTGSPYYWKVVARPVEHTKLTKKVAGAEVDVNDRYESTRMRGDIVQHDLIPFFNFMYPTDQEVEFCDWCAEREKNNRADDILKEWKSDQLFLLKDDQEAENLAKSTVDLFDPFVAKAAASTEKKTPQKPTQVVDRWLTWFYWTVRYKDPEGGKTKIKKLNLLGSFHRTNGKLMNCFLNDYEHQERPYELIDQVDDGWCTTQNMKYHQTLFTHLAQAEVKNAYHANNMLYWHDPDDTRMGTFFTANPTLGPGSHVPGKEGEAWGLVRAGAAHYSLNEMMTLVLSMSQLDSKQNKYSQGNPGGRTPANTMAMALQQAREEPDLFLHSLSNKLARIMRLDLETRRQYQPLGEVLPMWDPQQKRYVEIAMRFPLGDCLDNFRIALTASDDALKKEQDQTVIMAKKQALMEDGKYVAQVVGPIMNISSPLPAEGVALFEKIIMRDQKALMDLLGTVTTEEDAFDLSKELLALVEARNKQIQMKQQQDMELQHAMLANGGQKPLQPEPPRISFSLTGQMSPDMVAQVAALAGIHGGMNAQMPPAGPGAPVPGGNPNPGGAPNGPGPTGGQPAIPQPPPPAPAQNVPQSPEGPVQ